MSMNSQKSAPVHYPGSVFPKNDKKTVKNPEEKVGSLTNWVIGKPRKIYEISGFDPNSKPQKHIILAIRIDF